MLNLNVKRINQTLAALLVLVMVLPIFTPLNVFAALPSNEGTEEESVEMPFPEELEEEGETGWIVPEYNFTPPSRNGYKLEASSDVLELWVSYKARSTDSKGKVLSPGNITICVRDLRNNFVWYQSPPGDLLSRSGMQPAQTNILDSLLSLTKTNLNQNNEMTTQENILQQEPDIKYGKLDDGRNGIWILYNVDKFYFKIGMELWLEGDTLVASVPYETIEEGEKSEEILTAKLKKIRDFIDYGHSVTQAMYNDANIKRYHSAARKIDKELDDFSKMLDEINDVVGIEYITSKIREAFRKVTRAVKGSGSKNKSVFRKIEKDMRVVESSRNIWAQKLKEFSAKIDTCNIHLSALKTIKVYGVVEIDIMQYFGAFVDDDEDAGAYALYNDGSGGITYAKKEHPATLGMFEGWTFSDDTYSLSWDMYQDETGLKRTPMSYFGVKKGYNAFIATASGAVENSKTAFYPTGYSNMELYRSYASFKYRRAVAADTISGVYANRTFSIIDKNKLEITPEVRYMFLCEPGGFNDKGEENYDSSFPVEYSADYSGMAQRLQKYLIDSNKLVRSSYMDEKDMPLTMNVLGNVRYQVLMRDKVVNMTSYSELAEITKTLSDSGVKNMLVNFYGWSNDGYGRYPTKQAAARSLGGMSDLQNMFKTAEDNNASVFLEDDFILCITGLNRNKNADLIQTSQMRTFKGYRSIFRTEVALENLDKGLSFQKKVGSHGITLDKVGSFLYFDYTRKNEVQRDGTVLAYQEMMQNSKDALGSVAVKGANSYSFAYADWIQNVPMGSTNYTFTDEMIPFYQMVLHGYIPYTGKAFNEFYNKDYEFLKAVEYGCLPLYEITYNETILLRDAYNVFLLSSQFSDWHGDMIDTYSVFTDNIPDIWKQKIVQHEVIEKDFKRVRYQDDSGKYTDIYINYTDYQKTAQIADGSYIQVDPLGYEVVKG